MYSYQELEPGLLDLIHEGMILCPFFAKQSMEICNKHPGSDLVIDSPMQLIRGVVPQISHQSSIEKDKTP